MQIMQFRAHQKEAVTLAINSVLLLLTGLNGERIAFAMGELAYKSLNKSLEIRMASHARANQMSAKQPLGYDEPLTIEGSLYPLERGANQNLDDLKSYAKAFVPFMVTDGRGVIYGRHLIQSVSEATEKHFSDGLERVNNYQITLVPIGRKIKAAK